MSPQLPIVSTRPTAAAFVAFVAMRLLPGDPLVAIFGLEGARRLTTEQRTHLEQALGLEPNDARAADVILSYLPD